jgi:hypothetical protein
VLLDSPMQIANFSNAKLTTRVQEVEEWVARSEKFHSCRWEFLFMCV